MIWNCTLQKSALTWSIFFSSKFPLKLSAAPCSMLSLCISVYGGKNVIANSNMTLSRSQVSLTETESPERLLKCLSCLALFDVMWHFPAYLPHNLRTDLQWPLGTCLSVAFALEIVFGLKINHLEEFVKPWCLLTMLLETVLIKSLSLYQVLEWVCVYSQQALLSQT